MNLRKKFLFLAILFLVWSFGIGAQSIAADALIGIDFLVTNGKQLDGNTVGNGQAFEYYSDTSLGGIFWNSLYLGLIFTNYESTSVSGSTKSPLDRRSAPGVSLGYVAGGFFVNANYFTSATEMLYGTTKLTKGSAIGAEIGHRIMVGRTFYLGLKGAYRAWTFTEIQQNGVTTVETNKIAMFNPMVGLGFIF